MSDEHLDRTIRKLAEDYREPTPELDDSLREEMWSAIAARRGRPVADIEPEHAAWWRGWWPMAAAALILLGIGIGRGLPPSSDRSQGTGSAQTSSTEAPGEIRWKQTTAEALYRLAMRDYLRRTQTELTRYQFASADPVTNDPDAPVTDWAGALLVRTRIFLDSPVADDGQMRKLLEDLEVVLARIVQSSGDSSPQDEAFILEGMRRQAILERLQKNLPTQTDLSKPATGT